MESYKLLLKEDKTVSVSIIRRILKIILLDLINNKEYRYFYSFFDPEYFVQEDFIKTKKEFINYDFIESEYEIFYLNEDQKNHLLFMTKREIVNSSVDRLLKDLELVQYLI